MESFRCLGRAAGLLSAGSHKPVVVRLVSRASLLSTGSSTCCAWIKQARICSNLRSFSSCRSIFLFYAHYTAEELALVRQAHLEGKRKDQIMDLVTSVDRPHPAMNELLQRALGERSLSREYIGISPSARLPRRPWSAAEDEALVRGRASGRTYRRVAEELGRSLASVSDRARKIIGPKVIQASTQDAALKSLVRRTSRRSLRRWTEEDDAQLEQQWKRGLSDEVIAETLPFETSARGVRDRRKRVGLIAYTKKSMPAVWTTSQDDELRQICADRSLNNREIGKRLFPPRTEAAVAVRKVALGLSVRIRYWGPSEDMELRQLWGQGLRVAENANLLRRPESGVRRRLSTLKLRKRIERVYAQAPRGWSNEDRQKLLTLKETGNSNAQIAEKMGRTESSIYRQLSRT